MFDELDHIFFHRHHQKAAESSDGEAQMPIELLSEGATILLVAFVAVVVFFTFRLILHVERQEDLERQRKGL